MCSVFLISLSLFAQFIFQASLEIKRIFVRYVSHEIRTPLSTTLMGLNLLENELKQGNIDCGSLMEMISDATGSCGIAIEILNDLLLYEKIDGGLLTLEKAPVNVWKFVNDVLKVFLIQVSWLYIMVSFCYGLPFILFCFDGCFAGKKL
jgi:signal transduction histidine kinase